MSPTFSLQPSHHLRRTASIHKDIPVPAGPAPSPVSGLDVHRSTGMNGESEWKSYATIAERCCWGLRLNHLRQNLKEATHVAPRPNQRSGSESPGGGVSCGRRRADSSCLNINAVCVHATPEPAVSPQLIKISIVANRLPCG